MTAESDLESFIAEFAPEVQVRIRSCRAKMQARFPGAVQSVYDNYNFLVIGFGPTSPSDAVFSLAAHRRGVNLCFLQGGPELPDPSHLLRGSGTTVRNLPLDSADDLDLPEVRALLDTATGRATVPMDASERGELVIRSVSAKRRART
jgi:hypothetical protein